MMKKSFFAVLFVLSFLLLCDASVKEISCEKFNVVPSPLSAELKQCLLNEVTIINSPDYVIVSTSDENETIESITFAYNKNIKYLPQGVHEVFPNLRWYDAVMCAIKKISKANFAQLGKVQMLNLDGNLIEEIESGTFEDLTSLQEIYISYNKIKFIHADVFNGLQSLKRVDLFNNVCINDDFNSEEKLKTLSQAVTDKCQASTSVRACEDEVKYLRVLLELKQRKIEDLEKQLE